MSTVDAVALVEQMLQDHELAARIALEEADPSMAGLRDDEAAAVVADARRIVRSLDQSDDVDGFTMHQPERPAVERLVPVDDLALLARTGRMRLPNTGGSDKYDIGIVRSW